MIRDAQVPLLNVFSIPSIRKHVISFLIMPNALETQRSSLIALIMARCKLWPKEFAANLVSYQIITLSLTIQIRFSSDSPIHHITDFIDSARFSPLGQQA